MEGSAQLLATLERLFGESVSIRGKHGVGGGCINQTSLLELTDGRKVFLKENSASYKGLFESEVAGLRSLSVEGGPRVPQPLAFTEADGRQYLLLEYVETGSRGKDFWEDFGRRLAHLHKVKRNERFGFDIDNYIGATPQINRWEVSWPRFFAQERLAFQLELARKNGYGRERWFGGAEHLVERMEELLPEPDSASILHGDLWGGNFMVDAQGRAVLIDPATYYGDREADLAMSELFGGFHRRFYDSYNEEFPIDPGYRERKHLYNLYHLLNHLNLFGASYAASVADTVARLR